MAYGKGVPYGGRRKTQDGTLVDGEVYGTLVVEENLINAKQPEIIYFSLSFCFNFLLQIFLFCYNLFFYADSQLQVGQVST